MPAPAGSRQIVVSAAIAARIEVLRDALRKKGGRTVSLGETVARSVEALEANHADGRWLNPSEAAATMEARLKQTVTELVGGIVHHVAPDAGYRGIAFDDLNGIAIAVFDDGGHDPIAVQIGEPRAEIAAAPHN